MHLKMYKWSQSLKCPD